MLPLIAMFLLGFMFAGCLMALFVIHNLFAEDDAQDDHLEEMAKWYKESYEEDDRC